MVGIYLADGDKGPGDKRIKIKTNGWEVLRYRHLLRIILKLYENEERIYPRPKYEGGRKLLRAIEHACLTGNIEATLVKFQLEDPQFLEDPKLKEAK